LVVGLGGYAFDKRISGIPKRERKEKQRKGSELDIRKGSELDIGHFFLVHRQGAEFRVQRIMNTDYYLLVMPH
jgi:hypothetical protein